MLLDHHHVATMEISPAFSQMNLWLDDTHREAVPIDTRRARDALVLRTKS